MSTFTLFLLYIVPCVIISGGVYYLVHDDKPDPRTEKGKAVLAVFWTGLIPVFNLLFLIFIICSIIAEILNSLICKQE